VARLLTLNINNINIGWERPDHAVYVKCFFFYESKNIKKYHATHGSYNHRIENDPVLEMQFLGEKPNIAFLAHINKKHHVTACGIVYKKKKNELYTFTLKDSERERSTVPITELSIKAMTITLISSSSLY